MNANSTTRTLQSYLPLAAIGGLLVLINRALIGYDPYYAIRSRINLPAAELRAFGISEEGFVGRNQFASDVLRYHHHGFSSFTCMIKDVIRQCKDFE